MTVERRRRNIAKLASSETGLLRHCTYFDQVILAQVRFETGWLARFSTKQTGKGHRYDPPAGRIARMLRDAVASTP